MERINKVTRNRFSDGVLKKRGGGDFSTSYVNFNTVAGNKQHTHKQNEHDFMSLDRLFYDIWSISVSYNIRVQVQISRRQQ